MNPRSWFILSPTRLVAHLFALLLVLASFQEYLRTTSPTIEFEDSTEFIAVSQVLGITHPTGYPLYSLLGKVFSQIPIKDRSLAVGRDLHSIAFRYNLFNCFLASLNLCLIYYLVLFWLGGGNPLPDEPREDPFWRMTGLGFCLFTGLIFTGFIKNYWRQTTFAEVYLLHTTLLLVQLHLLTRWRTTVIAGEESTPIFDTFCLFYGLSFGNHMTNGLWAPVHLLFIFFTRPALLLQPFRLLRALLLSFAGFGIYLYLPLRSAMGTEFSWFPVDDFEKFRWMVLAKGYQATHFFQKLGGQGLIPFFAAKFTELGRMAFGEMPRLMVFLGLAGIPFMVASSPVGALHLILLFFCNLLYFMIYQFHPDFLVPNSLLFGVPLCFTLIAITRVGGWLHPYLGRLIPLALFLGLLLSLRPDLGKIRKEVDRSGNYDAWNYAVNVLNEIGRGGFALFSQDAMAPLMYFQHVEKRRPDITFLHEFLYPFQKVGLDSPQHPHPPFQQKLEEIEKEYILPRIDRFPCYFVSGDPGRGQNFDYLINFFKPKYDLFPAGYLYRIESKNRLFAPPAPGTSTRELLNPMVASNFEIATPTPAIRDDIRWGNLFTQFGHDLSSSELCYGDILKLRLYFEATLPIKFNYKMMLFLTEKSPAGFENLLHSIEREPTDGQWPTLNWKWQHKIRDEIHIPLRSAVFKHNGTIFLKIGFFNPTLKSANFRDSRLLMMPAHMNFPQSGEDNPEAGFLDYHIATIATLTLKNAQRPTPESLPKIIEYPY